LVDAFVQHLINTSSTVSAKPVPSTQLSMVQHVSATPATKCKTASVSKTALMPLGTATPVFAGPVTTSSMESVANVIPTVPIQTFN